MSRISERKIFTLLDLRDGFHQIRVHPEHMKYFAFATPDGQFEYTRLPFGYSESPAEFQKRLVQILQPLIRADKVIVYIDDILIPSDSIEENMNTLKEVLVTFKRYGLELNYKKCQFFKTEIEYLGYMVSPEGITLSKRQINAIENFPQPRNMLEVQRFLGLANYFRKFVKNYSLIARPLHHLLKKDALFDFNENCKRAFVSLKKALTSFPVLQLYNPLAPTELHRDASAQGLAAILLQKQSSNKWAPVAYFSQTTNKAETNYHNFELEMLAMVRAIERFHIYLYSLEFTIVTDCNALTHAVNKANLNPCIARWTMALQNYTFKMEHRPGTRMAHVDALSRQICYVNPLPLERELEFMQLQDSRLREIAHELEFSDNPKFELIDGLYTKGGRINPDS